MIDIFTLQKYNIELFNIRIFNIEESRFEMEKKNTVTLLHNLADVYENACQPICKQMGVPQTAFSILMFLADNPEYYTAKDVSKFHALKANLVSFNVNKLVEEGYLERVAIPGNRRSIRLVCTKKAEPIIEEGRDIIRNFYTNLMQGMSEEDMTRFYGYMDLIGNNIMILKKSLEKKNV